MAKLSSLKLKMGQMQYEKQMKEQKIQELKVGIPQGGYCLWLWPKDLLFTYCCTVTLLSGTFIEAFSFKFKHLLIYSGHS